MRSVVLVVLAGCGSPDPAPPPPPVAHDPWAAAPVADAHVDGLAHVGELLPKLAALRSLSFEHDVPRSYQDAATFEAFARTEIGKDLPHPEDTSAALARIGLLAEPVDLVAVEQQALATQAGAYYSSQEKRFYLLLAPDGIALDGLVVHELVHALQDQHWNLDKLLPRDIDADHLLARRFLAEGDATFTMFLYALGELRGSISPEMVRVLRGQLDQLVRMSPSEMAKQNVLGVAANVEPKLAGSLTAFESLPPTVIVPIFDSYIYGAELVAAAFEHGGWKAVDALYLDPPASTEQVLHPETKLFAHRDPPIAVDIPVPAGETVIADLVMGELQWQVYFQLWLPARKIVASEGWGGDRVIVTRRAGKLCARIRTVWDSWSDADEFRTAYLASLKTRFPRDDRAITVHQDGVRVAIDDCL
ncbi:MAG: hypothetical protein QM831_12970 [Kofleriaceae bacterium]